MKLGIASLIGLLTCGSVLAQDVPDPEIERQSFKVADGFEVTLFAADPSIAKPIGMNFDAQGRLWVVSSSMYPQIKPGELPSDKVIVLEDTDGDGKAEKATTFADGLLIPTGIEFGDGGVYVGASTELLHFKDTNGDGKADVKRIVLSGFGTEDTHHTIHTLRFGFDGQLYFNQSIYIHADIETPWGPRHLSGSGTWRLRPRSMQLEVMTRGLVNPWGHTWDYWGMGFATDGAGGDGVSVSNMPGAAYGNWGTDARRWLSGVNPGSPKYCGAEIVSGRHLPDDWQGNLVTNDFRANRVVRFMMREEGSGYTAALQPDVIKSSSKAFRPIDVKMGPDGAIYIADWYNPVINHGEVDFRSPLRDHTRGRIWKLTAKNRVLVPRPQLVNASPEQLLERLKSPEGWTRHQARRVMYERGAKEILPALEKWVAVLDPADAQYEHNLLEALWTYQTLDVVEPNLLKQLLRATTPQARAAATRVLYYWHDRIENPHALLALQINDEFPKVRQEAILALGQIKSIRSVELAMTALERPVDRWIDYAIYIMANRLKDIWLPAVQRGEFTFNGSTRYMAMALEQVGSEDAVPLLLGLLRSGKLDDNRAATFIDLIGDMGTALQLAQLWEWSASLRNDALHARTLSAMERAARQRGIRPGGPPLALKPLLSDPNEPVRTAAIRLAGVWKLEELRSTIAEQANNASPRILAAVIESMGNLGGQPSAQFLGQYAKPGHPIKTRVAAIVALANIDLKDAAGRAAELLATEPSADPAPLIEAMLKRQDGGNALAEALANGKLSVDSAKLALRYLYSTGLNQPALNDILRQLAEVGGGLAITTPEQMKALIAEIQARGDARRGEAVFRGKMLSCSTCHAIGGAGGSLGPDLSAVGSASPLEYLIDSVLTPSKNIKEGYDAIAITTKSGDFYSGIRSTGSDKEIVLRDAIRNDIRIPVKDIKDRKPAGSLMPSGLADLLTRAEFIDLVKYLSVLGTPGYDVGNSTAVRRWRAVEAGPPALASTNDDTLARLLVAEDLLWSPAYSTIAGDLPLSDLPRPAGDVSILQFDVEVTTGGRIRIELPTADGLDFFHNGGKLEVEDQRAFELELVAGQHTFTLRIDRARIKAESIRINITEARGSSARFRIIGGR